MAKLVLKMKVQQVTHVSESQRVVTLAAEGGPEASLEVRCSASLAKFFDEGSAFNVEVEAAEAGKKAAKRRK